jgi:hypothetical protein
MKKILIFLSLIFACYIIQAQSATVIKQELTAATVKGKGTATTTLPTVQGEYDLSLQLIPALYGVGTSYSFSYIPYASNSDVDAIWTALAAADSVTTVTDSDAIYTITDVKNLRIKVIYTGLSTDTITVTPYVVFKKHANE